MQILQSTDKPKDNDILETTGNVRLMSSVCKNKSPQCRHVHYCAGPLLLLSQIQRDDRISSASFLLTRTAGYVWIPWDMYWGI